MNPLLSMSFFQILFIYVKHTDLAAVLDFVSCYVDYID